MGLSAKNCVPCKGGLEPLSVIESQKHLSEIEGWKLVEGSTALLRKLRFKNYVQAQDFVVKIGEIAETQGHHPDITFSWGFVEVKIRTHKINGLHENDFILASKISDLAANDSTVING